MAIQRELRQIIFGEGIDTQPDPNVIPIGKLRKLENGIFLKPGAIRKKSGSVAFGTASVDYSTTETIKSIFVFNGVLYKIQKNTGGSFTPPGPVRDSNYAGPDHILSWSPTLQKWTNVSGCASIFGRTVLDSVAIRYGVSTGIQQSTSAASNAITVAISGYLLTLTWQSNNTVNQSSQAIVTDTNTGAVVLRQQIGSLALLKTIVFGGKVYIFGCADGATTENLYYYIFDPSAMTLTLNATPLITTLGDGATQTNNLYDICVFSNTIFLVYKNATPNIIINSYTSLPTSGAATVVNTATIAETAVSFLSVSGANIGGNDRVLVVWRSDSGGSNRVRGATYSTAVASIVAATTIDTELTATRTFMQGSSVNGQTFTTPGGTEGFCVVVSQVDVASANRVRCVVYLVNASLGVVLSNIAANQTLLSKPFSYSSQGYFFSVCETDDYRTILLNHVDFSQPSFAYAKPVVKLLNGDSIRSLYLAGTGSVAAQLNTVNEPTISGTKAYFGTLKEIGTFSGEVQYYPNAIEIDFDHPNKYQSKKVGDLLYFNGGIPGCFDGRAFSEVSFVIAPRKPVLTAGAAGSLTVSSTYQIVLVRKRIDAYGGVHYSEPSLPISVTLSAIQNSITIAFEDQDNYGPSWEAFSSTLVFRTEANGTIFYLDQELYNTSFSTVSTQADSTLIQNEVLYTTGDVLSNESATSSTSIAIFKERLFALTSEGLFHTKQVTQGQPAAFSSFFQIQLVQGQRWPTAIVTFLDKLLIFFTDSIYYISGDGPNDTGDLGAFSAPQLINAGYGCINSSSILEKESEVWFQSAKGWSKINADLSIEMVGGELDHFITSSTQCYSMMYSDTFHQVRICDGNRSYVWDTDLKQWSIFTTYNDTKQIEWNNQIIRLNSGVLCYEDPDSGKDGSSFVTTLIGTGWIHLNNIQGFQRVYNAYIYGRLRSAHSLKVDVYYDGVPKVIESHTIDTSVLPLANFTDDNMYANNSYAGNERPYELRIQLGRQQCQTIAFDIYDTAQAGTGQSMDLVGLNIEIGLKKQRPNLRVGSGAQA